MAAVNNVTFVMPKIAILQSHYYKIGGVFTEDFPGNPPFVYDYTGHPPANIQTTNGTKVYRLPYNSTVQLVIQDTAVIAPESHPVHLHGYNVFVVGKGSGNFDPIEDPKGFNLVDPVERNTFGVPNGGWTAIRFRADNPGEEKACSPVSCSSSLVENFEIILFELHFFFLFRCLVLALPFGSTHDVGTENGVSGGKWKRPRRVFAAAAQRSSSVLGFVLTLFSKSFKKRKRIH